MRFNKSCRGYFSVAVMLMCSASFAEIRKDEAVNLLGDPKVAQCQVWYVRAANQDEYYALLMPNMDLIGISHKGLLGDGMSMLVNGSTEANESEIKNKQGYARLLLLKALYGSGVARCALLSSPLEDINNEIRQISGPVREFIKNDLKTLVINEAKNELQNLANELKKANEAEREKIIDRLITEIPQQKELIDAIKKALEK